MYTGESTEEAALAESVEYGYNTSGRWKDLLKTYNGQAITNDAIGNPLQYRDSMVFTWSGRRLSTVTQGEKSVSYSYDQNGIRQSKTVGGVQTEYFLSGDTVIAQKTGDSVLWILRDTDGSAQGFEVDGNSYYYLKNQQGDVTALVDETGAIVGRYTYDAWGNITSVQDGLGNDVSTDATHPANANPLRYRSYYYDAETGFYYLNSRYYDPVTGRFLIPDKILNDGNVLIGYNLFMYGWNNPVNKVDHTGNAPGDFFLSVEAAANDFHNYYKGVYDYEIYAQIIPKIKIVTGPYYETIQVPVPGSNRTREIEVRKTYVIKVQGYTYYRKPRVVGFERFVMPDYNPLSVAEIHTHVNNNSKNHSTADKLWAEVRGVPYYVSAETEPFPTPYFPICNGNVDLIMQTYWGDLVDDFHRELEGLWKQIFPN